MLSDFLHEDLEAARKRREWWTKLRKARADFHNDTVETQHPSVAGFNAFMQEKWGIRIGLDNQSNITDTYEIVDEGKHLLFMIKYGN